MRISQICFPERGRVVYEETDAKIEVGRHDILIRTLYTAVSAGTELAKLTGAQAVSYPYVPGNRAVGEIVETGRDVRDFAVGDRVFSHTPHVSHAKATAFCVKVPDTVELRYAPLVGLGLVAMTALRVARPELGDRAVVIGMGVVGNLCAQLLENSGVEVIGVDMLRERLDRAGRCGVSHAVNAQVEDVPSKVMAITGARGADLVVEATGNPAAMDLACAVAARQADVILLGSPRGECRADLTPLLQAVHLWKDHGSLTLKGAHEWRYPLYPQPFTKHSMKRNADILFRMMADGRLNLRDLVTHVLPPEQAAATFDGLLNDKRRHLGVVFDWTRREA